LLLSRTKGRTEVGLPERPSPWLEMGWTSISCPGSSFKPGLGRKMGCLGYSSSGEKGSQNHGDMNVGKELPDPQISPVTAPHLVPSPGHPVPHPGDTCRDRHCKPPWAGLSTLSMQKFLLVSTLSLPWPSLRPFPLGLSLFPGSRARPPLAVPSWQGLVQSHKGPVPGIW
uniref:Uncharacterized protein n=1 Tax=Geospiza parvula TaxID=87175 RepID=A0A8U8B5V3_GEOPR